LTVSGNSLTPDEVELPACQIIGSNSPGATWSFGQKSFDRLYESAFKKGDSLFSRWTTELQRCPEVIIPRAEHIFIYNRVVGQVAEASEINIRAVHPRESFRSARSTASSGRDAALG